MLVLISRGRYREGIAAAEIAYFGVNRLYHYLSPSIQKSPFFSRAVEECPASFLQGTDIHAAKLPGLYLFRNGVRVVEVRPDLLSLGVDVEIAEVAVGLLSSTMATPSIMGETDFQSLDSGRVVPSA